MNAFAACSLVLLIAPMVILNPLGGRDVFAAYYLGVATMWAATVIASRRVRAGER